MTKIILLDLFSGIGGFAKGFHDAGFEVVAHGFSEVEPNAIACYQYQFKNAVNYGSIKSFQSIIASVEQLRQQYSGTPLVVTFGSPCQDFSLAGKRIGLDGDNSSLIEFALRIIERLRPDVFVWENVKNVFSTRGGSDYWEIIKRFTNLDGYRHECELLNTAFVLPQNRERIYFVGHLAGRSTRNVFPIQESDFQYSKPKKAKEIHEVALCLTKKGITNNTGIFIKQVNINKNFGSSPRQQDRIYDANGIMCTIPKSDAADKTKIRIKRKKRIVTKPHGYNKGNTVDVCPTLKKSSFEHNNFLEIESDEEEYIYRRMTEIEIERLQGFPDDWTKYGLYRKKGELQEKPIPKTWRYSMVGNSVTVPLVEAIARKLSFIDLTESP